jgi:hypothetical protein
MHEDYDNEYDDDEYDYDHPSLNPYQWFFKFDVGQDSPLSSWISDLINSVMNNDFDIQNIPAFPVNKFPVNSWNPDAGKGKIFQYLGSNYNGEPIWKSKYFIHDELQSEYINHLSSHAAYFVKQPSYYKSLYEILN